MKRKQHNLVWVHVEGGGGGMALPAPGRTAPIESLPWPAVRLEGMTCCWMSTIGSVSGMLTGVSPSRLLRTHIPKGQAADPARFDLPHPPLPQGLEALGYQVEGFSMFLCFREQLPFFRERGAGLSPDLPATLPRGKTLPGAESLGRQGANHLYRYQDVMGQTNVSLPDSSTLERVRRVLGAQDPDRPRAFFLHLNGSDVLPELLRTFSDHGVLPSNTVLLVVGDHGYPLHDYERCLEDTPAYVSHDRGASERDFRVVCHIGYPDCPAARFNGLATGTDLAPTVAALLGLDPRQLLPGAAGLDLTPYLEGRGDYPRRTLRIDNRFVGQQHLKFACLVDEEHRYVVRQSEEWTDQPYYGYRLHATPGREELYARADIDGLENLAASPAHLGVLRRFRDAFAREESELVRHHYSEDLFQYPPLREASQAALPSHVYPPGGTFSLSWERVVAGLALLLRQRLEQGGTRRPVLYGADRDAARLLDCGVFSRADFVAVVDDPGGPRVLDGVLAPGDLAGLEYDAVVLCSRRMEVAQLRRCRAWKRPGAALFSLYRELLPEAPALACLPLPDADTARRLAGAPAALYGAGGRARDFLARGHAAALGLDLRLVLDGDPAKDGTLFEGLPVRSVWSLTERDPGELGVEALLIASAHSREILSLVRTWPLAGVDLYVVDDALGVHPVTESLNGLHFHRSRPTLKRS